MSDISDTTSAHTDAVLIRLAVTAYLGRYTGASRQHSHSDLRPGGAVEVQLEYDGRADRVWQYTDGHGGTYTVGLPTVEGDGVRYGASVESSTPAGYWRMTEESGTVAGGKAQLSSFKKERIPSSACSATNEPRWTPSVRYNEP